MAISYCYVVRSDDKAYYKAMNEGLIDLHIYLLHFGQVDMNLFIAAFQICNCEVQIVYRLSTVGHRKWYRLIGEHVFLKYEIPQNMRRTSVNKDIHGISYVSFIFF